MIDAMESLEKVVEGYSALFPLQEVNKLYKVCKVFSKFPNPILLIFTTKGNYCYVIVWRFSFIPFLMNNGTFSAGIRNRGQC